MTLLSLLPLVQEPLNMEKVFFTHLDKFMNQIDTITCDDYTITNIFLYKYILIKRASYMTVISVHIFQRQNKQMRKMLIPLCNNSTDIYHLNVLRVFNIIYHMYIKCESYYLEYK